MHWLWMILIGFVVGLVARALKPGDDKMGFIFTTLFGIGGALAAGFVGTRLGWYQQGEPAGFLASVVGAMVLLALYAIFRKNRAPRV